MALEQKNMLLRKMSAVMAVCPMHETTASVQWAVRPCSGRLVHVLRVEVVEGAARPDAPRCSCALVAVAAVVEVYSIQKK